MIPNMRPNVFTSCSITYKRPERIYPAIGVIAQADETYQSQALKVNKIDSITTAKQLYGTDSPICCMISAILENIYTDVYAVSVINTAEIPSAFDKLISIQDIYCIAIDTENASIITSMNKKLSSGGSSSNPKLCICSTGNKTTEQAVSLANSINSSRIILSAPYIYYPFTNASISPSLIATAITKGNYISSNLAGVVLSGKYHTSSSLSEQDINSLLYNGVTVIEKNGDSFEIIRAVTTSTKNTVNEQDNTYRDIGVIYALDKVSSRISNLLKSQLKSTSSSESSLGALTTIIVSELEQLKKQRYLANYKKPVVRLDSGDLSICIVELEVTLSQGVNQIYVTLNITV